MFYAPTSELNRQDTCYNEAQTSPTPGSPVSSSRIQISLLRHGHDREGLELSDLDEEDAKED